MKNNSLFTFWLLEDTLKRLDICITIGYSSDILLNYIKIHGVHY